MMIVTMLFHILSLELVEGVKDSIRNTLSTVHFVTHSHFINSWRCASGGCSESGEDSSRIPGENLSQVHILSIAVTYLDSPNHTPVSQPATGKNLLSSCYVKSSVRDS